MGTLLTGASGNVGSAVLRSLEELGEPTIALQRLGHIASATSEVVKGDICCELLGMTPDQYGDLVGRVTAVVHSAAVTDFSADPSLIHETNVLGTKNMLKFASRASVPFYYVSTAYVRTKSDLASQPNEYELSKRTCEDMVRQSGLKYGIFRPSIVVGSREDGILPRQQAFHAFLRLLLAGRLPAIPCSPDSLVDFVPRDLVGNYIAKAVLAGGTKEHWLTSGCRSMSVQEIVKICDRDIQYISPDAYRRLFLPAFLPSLPQRQRLVFEKLSGIVRYLNLVEGFPSDLDFSPQAVIKANVDRLSNRKMRIAG